MNRSTLFSTLLLATGALTVGAPAFAEPAQAQLTMAQAVTIAEARLNGRVVKARLAKEDAANVYNFKLATAGNELLRVRVPATGGGVLSSQKDDDRHERQSFIE